MNHEDLRDQIFRNRNEIAGDGIDNDGNGCIDDDLGCDFVNQDGVHGPLLSEHATHVSGIVERAGPERIRAFRALLRRSSSFRSRPKCRTTRSFEAIDYAEANGVRIINCSQGSSEENFFNPAVRDAMAASNVLFVCSGGNRGTPRLNFPSSYPSANILGVSNVTNIGEISDHSSYGRDHIDIAAPGRSILSSILDNDYGTIDGTSQAAPHVAGVAALVRKSFPALTAAQIADRLVRTAMRMTTMTDMVRANGIVDARAALEDVGPVQPSAMSAAGRITLSWAAQPGATRYDVERDGTVVSNGTATTHVHSGLVVNSGHIYRVRAIVGTSTGAWSYRLMAKASLMPTSEPFVRESLHPYPNDFEQTYIVRKTGGHAPARPFLTPRLAPGRHRSITCAFSWTSASRSTRHLSGSYPTGFWTHWRNEDRFNFTFRSPTRPAPPSDLRSIASSTSA